MEEIKILKEIDAVNPVIIAGWPGMGSVALGVVEYLRRKLPITRFAEITLDRESTIDSVVVQRGLAAMPPAPKNVFYYSKKYDLILCEGEAQLSGSGGVRLLNKVIDLAIKYNTKMIYTGAAFPMPVSYKEDPKVFFAGNRKGLTPVMTRQHLKSMQAGHISGLNGLVLGLAAEKGLDAVCLLATMPQYAVSLPNPKASRAIIAVLEKILSFNVSLSDIEVFVKDMDEKMALIEDKVKDVFTIEKEQRPPEKTSADDKKVPGYIIDKIERLFGEAKADRSKATLLKEELDRWDLYKAYEDRFLDLFKGKQ